MTLENTACASAETHSGLGLEQLLQHRQAVSEEGSVVRGGSVLAEAREHCCLLRCCLPGTCLGSNENVLPLKQQGNCFLLQTRQEVRVTPCHHHTNDGGTDCSQPLALPVGENTSKFLPE